MPVNVSIKLICATHIPPLRERKDDIVWLARRLLADLAAGNVKSPGAD